MKEYVPKPKFIKDDFYGVERTGWLPVNKSGFVLLEDGTKVLGVINGDWPYYQYGGQLIHRAVALTFLNCPGDPNKYQVNHKDGDKLNNNCDNLEWVTVSDNVNHAYKTGLRKDNRPVLVKDHENGEVTRYHSLQECARNFKVNGSLIHLYLKNTKNPKQLWRHRWLIIYEGDEWPDIEKGPSKGYPREVIAIPHDESLKKVIFPSLTEAAKYFSIDRGTLGWYLNRLGAGKSNTYIGYDWYYLKEYLGDKSDVVRKGDAVRRKNNLSKRKPKRVKVTNLATGEIEVWESLKVLSDSMGWKKNSLEKAIWRNNGTFQGKKYEYIKDKVLSTSDRRVVSL